MASLTLESLPVELVEEIVAWLDFHDHCALRLTGRSVSVKSSKAAFRKYFLSKKLEIAEAPLEQFVSVTQPGRFGLWVQDLTLFASIALHAEVPPASPKVFELLAQAFQNIRNDSPHNEPLSITLKVFGDGYLKAAADTVFQVTMSALRRSGLPIRAFNAFAEGYSHTYGGRCSFPFSEIPDALFGGSTADLTRLATAFQPCKKIGLSLAHYIHNLDYIRPRESPLRPDNLFELPPSYEEARENTRSLPHLLNLCPTLEELHLVWEYDDFEETAGVREELYFFERVVASCQFQGLKKCTLSDIRMSEATLMTFFRQLTRLVHLDLTSIYLDGNFDGLFRLLSTAMPELNYLHLRSLYSSSGTVRFLHEPRNNICDQERPACSQCLRIGQECPGYQDPQALRVYDQTAAVTTKALARAASTRKAARSPTAEKSKTPPLIAGPTNIQEQAMSHIFKYYVGTSQNPGILCYLPDLLRTGPSDALQATMKAIGLACMSRVYHLPELARSAAEEYSKALRATNTSLQDAVSATSDSTLGAVVTLSMYEIISGQSQMMAAWLNHARGALKLLELRGTKQFESAAGRRLFSSTRLQIAMINIFFRTSCHRSPTIAALSKYAKSVGDADAQTVEDFYNILVTFNDHSIKVKETYNNTGFRGNIAPLIKEALDLDADLVSWATSLSPTWQYSTTSTPLPFSHVRSHDTEYHVYPSIDNAVYWNHYRQARIILHEMIQAMCLHQATPDSPQIMHQSISINKQLAEDICASVPYFFTSGEAALGAVARLPWPLYLASDCAGVSPQTKDWIMQILDLIATSTGVQQARILSQFVKTGNHSYLLIPGKPKRIVDI
ncbi:Got1/Sft2-like family protein [Aspergillus niger]|uniref:Got1/Sft2-like family protein n=1 Tax=Aspergillus niger TaxID=5061 RepID=A0A505HLH6_ASPNG|nr:Got1/Sft2-like family protein [Aspergillus niger]